MTNALDKRALYVIAALAMSGIAAVALAGGQMSLRVPGLDMTLSKEVLVDVLNGDSRAAKEARRALVDEIENMHYAHSFADKLRQIERDGRGPWGAVPVTVVASDELNLGTNNAAVCRGGDFYGESFVIFASTGFTFKPFQGVVDASCPGTNRNVVWISSAVYRDLFADGQGPIETTGKRFPLKPQIVRPDIN